MLAAIAALSLAAKGTVVMIHGAGGGGWEYDKWRPVFEKAGWTVVNRDLVPVGGKYENTKFNDYVRQVLTWTPKHGKIVYIGASMGGILALKANEKHPASAVVLVNSVGPKGIGPKTDRKPNPPLVVWKDGPLKDTEDAMPDSDRETILWAWKRWRNESGAVMNQIHAGIPARRPKCPVLVVLGANDTDVPHATGLALAKWSSADVKTYENMSHVGPLMSTRAEGVASFVESWVNQKTN
ncbi:MAG: alpha/beta fold hydrolase [Armatimonadetes bacterium]|nr:alpha/beta fold hydrolase [Armatimonadota bacterium]